MGSEQANFDVRYKLTVRDFLMLYEAGAFREIGKVELVEGEIFVMAPLHRPHARVTTALTSLVDQAVRKLGAGLEVLSDPSAELNDHSLPQPDIVVARAVDESFVSRTTARLFIEIAVSSFGRDLGKKKQLYANAGVPEYWIADVERSMIIRFHAPLGEDYTERAEFAFGEPIASATILGLVVDTARLAAR